MIASTSRWPGRADFAVSATVYVLELALFWEYYALPSGSSWQSSVPLVELAACTILLWRRKRPTLVFVAVWWFTSIAADIPGYHPYLPILVALFTLAREQRSVISLQALAFVVVPFALLAPSPSSDHLRATILIVVGWWVIAALAWAAGARLRRAGDLESRLAADAAQAIAAERLRLARDLHDILAHTVSVMVIQAAGARRVLPSDPERADQALAAIDIAGQQSMQELHRLLGVLRTSDDDAPGEREHQPGLGDLDSLIGIAREAGTIITVETTGTPGPLDPSVELAAYRVVQESLTNVRKHAGERARATIRLDWTGSGLTVTVDDQPAVTSPVGSSLSTGHGLLGLRERVQAIGGSFRSGMGPNGYQVQADLPGSTAGTSRGRVRPDESDTP